VHIFTVVTTRLWAK